MSKVAVVYWTGTGNTAVMAKAVEDGAKQAGAEVDVFGPADFNATKLNDYTGVAFGCPAMGAEVLEEMEFEPMFSALEGQLNGKKIGIFGSYGWGDGEWMRDWQDRCRDAGANLVMDGVMANYEPSEFDISECKELGAAIC